MTKIIAVIGNGSSGKTATAVNISHCLSMQDKKVLLIDLNIFNADATSFYLGDDRVEYAIENALEKKNITEREIVNIEKNFDFIPAVAGIDVSHYCKSQLLPFLCDTLTNSSKVILKYDFVIIDCPTRVGDFINVIGSIANVLLFPIVAAPYYSSYVTDLLDKLYVYENYSHPKMLFFLNKYDTRIKMTHEIEKKLRDDFGINMLKAKVHVDVKMPASYRYKKSIFEYAPTSRAARDVTNLARELLGVSWAFSKTSVAPALKYTRASRTCSLKYPHHIAINRLVNMGKYRSPSYVVQAALQKFFKKEFPRIYMEYMQ